VNLPFFEQEVMANLERAVESIRAAQLLCENPGSILSMPLKFSV